MMDKPPGLRRLLPLLAASLLAACQTSETGSEPTQEPMVTEQPVGKVTAPVEISYQLLSEPRLGQPLEIQISSRPLRPDQAVTLAVNAGTGLSLASEARLPHRPVALGERRLDRVVVTPLANGRSFVNVIATVTMNGQQMHKAISIPVQVGDAAESRAEPVRDAEGTPIRSMPARESVDD